MKEIYQKYFWDETIPGAGTLVMYACVRKILENQIIILDPGPYTVEERREARIETIDLLERIDRLSKRLNDEG